MVNAANPYLKNYYVPGIVLGALYLFYLIEYFVMLIQPTLSIIWI